MLEEIHLTRQFKKDNRKLQRQGKDFRMFDAVLDSLIEERPLDPDLDDHPLQGAMRGYRELHVEPDWLLVYQVEGRRLVLLRTGSHAELFGK